MLFRSRHLGGVVDLFVWFAGKIWAAAKSVGEAIAGVAAAFTQLNDGNFSSALDILRESGAKTQGHLSELFGLDGVADDIKANISALAPRQPAPKPNDTTSGEFKLALAPDDVRRGEETNRILLQILDRSGAVAQ